jgi:hypothetical protein
MLSQSDPRTLTAQKRLFYAWVDATLSHSIWLGIDVYTLVYPVEEPGEEMRAFIDKRRPNWSPG